VIGIAYYTMLLLLTDSISLTSSPPQWPVILVGGLAGLLGSSIDSLLGAILQYSGLDKDSGVVVQHPGPGVQHISGMPLLDNHSVNLLSSWITSLLTPRLGLFIWGLMV